MTRLYIPERAQPFPTTKTELGGLLCEVPKRWIESFRVALEKQLDGIFDGTPPLGLAHHMPVPHFFEKRLPGVKTPHRQTFASIVGAPRCHYQINSLERVLAGRCRFFNENSLLDHHLGLLLVTETSLTALDPYAPGNNLAPGPSHAVELGMRHGFHVLQSTEVDLCSDFAAALERLHNPSAQTGWVNLP